jgi:hypothetical protein
MNPFARYLSEIDSLPIAARFERLKNEWNFAFDAASRIDRGAMNTAGTAGNTYTASLVTSFLVAGFITKLQNRWAPLLAFTRQFSTDAYKPRAKGELKYAKGATASSGDANGKNLTNFEDGDTDMEAVEVVVNQLTRPFNVSNSDLQGGLRMENLVDINVAKFADIIMGVVMGPLTAANYPATPLVCAAATFDWSDLQTLWGQLKKSRVKNLILDGTYMARIINAPTLYQKAGVASGTGWQDFGWDGIYQNTSWDGAETNVQGFACNPQAVGIIAGLPLQAPVSDQVLTRTDFTLPGLELSVSLYTWFSLPQRAGWCSLDVMLGASLLDGTAGVLIKSA